MRPSAPGYVVAAVLGALVGAYQVRVSLENFRVSRSYEFYIPFGVEPFTDRLSTGYVGLRGERLAAGDRLVRVNGKPFRGFSDYLTGLWRAEHEYRPFLATVATGGRTSDIFISIPHCTCGVPSAWEMAAIWIVAPFFCVALGFVGVGVRPRAMESWAWLALMLALSQVPLWERTVGYQFTWTLMAWDDWLRVPAVGYRAFVQHIWGAALLTGAASFDRERRGAFGLTLAVAIGMVLWAGVQTALAIAWSEDFRLLAPVYRWMEEYRTELWVAVLSVVVCIALVRNRRFGAMVTCAGLVCVAVVYSPPPAIREGVWWTYADGTFRFEAMIPRVHNDWGFAAGLFVAGSLIAGLITWWSEVRRRYRLWAALVLILPLAGWNLALLGEYVPPGGWWAVGGWFWSALGCAGVGLAGLSWLLISREGG